MIDTNLGEQPHLDQILAGDLINVAAFTKEHEGELAILSRVSQELERVCSLPCPADHRFLMLLMVHVGHRHLLATWRSLASLHVWDSSANLRLVVELAGHLTQIAHDLSKAQVWLDKATDPKGEKIRKAFTGGTKGARWNRMCPEHREAFEKAWHTLSELSHSNFRASMGKLQLDFKTGRYSFRFHDDLAEVQAVTRWMLRLGLVFAIEAHLCAHRVGLRDDPTVDVKQLRQMVGHIESTPQNAPMTVPPENTPG
jgi:hypothetical protein